VKPHCCRNRGIFTTTKDATFYVSPATGNDNNPGTSVAKPLKSLVAVKLLPYYSARIANKINIAVLDSEADPTKVPTTIDPIFVDGGSLAIYGVGAPTQKAVNGGPHTVTAVADVGPQAQRVTVAGAAWTADEFCGYWVRVVTGGHPGLTFPVYGNNTGDVSIALGDPDKVHNGDTVEIIYPTVKVDFSNLDIALQTHTLKSGASAESSCFVLANLWLDASASTNWMQFMMVGGSVYKDYPVLDFVRLDWQDLGGVFQNVCLGQGDAVDKSYVTDCGAGIANMGVVSYDAGVSINNTSGRGDIAVSVDEEVMIYGWAVLGGIQCYSGSLFMCGGCGYMKGTEVSAQGWFAGKDSSTPAVSVDAVGVGNFKIHVEGPCNYAIDVGSCARVYMHSANSCDPTLTALSAVRIGALSQVQIHDNCANFKGATVGQEAYIFSSNSTKSATWPGATTLVTDGLGAELMRTT
jgi:hypothetical protein